jgi:hypothetical protein
MEVVFVFLDIAWGSKGQKYCSEAGAHGRLLFPHIAAALTTLVIGRMHFSSRLRRLNLDQAGFSQ